MAKSILASAAALAFVIAPVAGMAQTTNNQTGASTETQKMKGPPNANGMQQDNGMKSGRSENSSGGSSNGAAGATSTGADRK